ncbi:MAG: hypothetical protein WCX08_03305 [Candidatus Buchananbacteria bacterium]|jgi:hypothetical protein
MKKTTLIVIIVIAVVIIGGIYVWQRLNMPSEQSKCTKQGGNWITGSSEYGSKCIIPYSDAGKKCTSSDQCLGQCVTNIISQLGKEGICQKDNDNQGCFNAIESERFNCLLDDIIITCDSRYWETMCDSLKGKEFFE